jgi:hypothetical protein
MEHRQAWDTCHEWTLHTGIAKEKETPRKAFDVRGHRQEGTECNSEEEEKLKRG